MGCVCALVCVVGGDAELYRQKGEGAYGEKHCKGSYFSINLAGSMLLKIREEGYDPRPQGAGCLLRSRDIGKQGGRRAVVAVQGR